MKRLSVIVLIWICAMLPVKAQWDTSSYSFTSRLNSHYIIPFATGAALGAAGAVFSYVPAVNEWAVALRDEVAYHDLPNLYVDDYLQYLPALTPVTLNLCGLQSRHKLSKMLLLEGASYLLGGGWLNAFKYRFGVLRPDESSYNSFPSGHTFMAFTGAELLRREYGEEYPWIAVAGYVVATLVGCMRVWHNRHWAGDVLAGAGLGIASVSLVYWVLD